VQKDKDRKNLNNDEANEENPISNFMFHFINFRYSLSNSKEVVLYFCKRYELDQSRTHLLLSELESAQN